MTAPDRDLAPQIAEVREELHRADTKASMLLALAGAGLVVLHDGGVDGLLGTFAVIELVVVLAVLLWVVFPSTRRAPFVRATDPGWEPETPAERMRALSKLAAAKMRRLQIAVVGLLIAVLLIGVDALL